MTSDLNVTCCSGRVVSRVTGRVGLGSVTRDRHVSRCPVSFNEAFSDLTFFTGDTIGVIVTRRGVVHRVTGQNRSFIVINEDTSMALGERGPYGVFICTSVASGVGHYGGHFRGSRGLARGSLRGGVGRISDTEHGRHSLLSPSG